MFTCEGRFGLLLDKGSDLYCSGCMTQPYLTRPVRVDARDLRAGDYIYLETSAGERVTSPEGEPTRIVGTV